MPDAEPAYDPHRFRTTVPFYARYRLGYPQSLIARVIANAGLRPADSVLDLGCGPGLLAVPFALSGMGVTAVDPEPAMLEAAQAQAREAGVVIRVLRGSSYDLPVGIGPFALVTMGRSFHWMNRAEALKTLDRLVLPGGALALFEDEHPKTAENRWRNVLLEEVGVRYGADEAPHRAARKSPDYRTHESLLLDSPFSALESVGVVVRREITADEIVGLAFSLSVMAPQKLGDRAAAFEADLRRELVALSPEGRFSEIAELRALIARRP